MSTIVRGALGALGALVLLGLATSQGRAQIKLPVFDQETDVKGPVWKPASTVADYKHGTFVRVTRTKGDGPILGTLVRVDRKGKRLFVRSEPGEPPVAVSQKDIKNVESSEIRPAGWGQPGQAEIHKVVIYNGPRMTVHYYTISLSPGERKLVTELEEAENELARLQHQLDFRERDQELDTAIRAERHRSHDLMNQMLTNQILASYLFGPPYGSFHSLNINHNQWDAGRPLPPPIPPDTLKKARERVEVALGRAVYEDGRIVAVVVSD